MASHILKLERHDADREIEFELKYLASLTIKQRFELMSGKTREILNLLKKNGHGKTTEIVKRT